MKIVYFYWADNTHHVTSDMPNQVNQELFDFLSKAAIWSDKLVLQVFLYKNTMFQLYRVKEDGMVSRMLARSFWPDVKQLELAWSSELAWIEKYKKLAALRRYKKILNQNKIKPN